MSQPSPQSVTSESAYQSLSALAIAGFMISCLFGGVVLVSAVIALTQGAPFFFPSWVLFIAVAGFVLSYVGANEIRNSEGTKAGARLATWGMGLSLVCGLGYFAYSYFTRLALAQQADTFLMTAGDDSGFFPRLKKSSKDKTEYYRAFLLTLPAFDRSGAKPEDEARMRLLHDQPTPEGGPSKLDRFRQDHLVNIIRQAGDDLTIETLGVEDWKYENRSYQVTRRYRLSAPEIVVEVALPVKSSEGEQEGQGRSWFIDVGAAQLLGERKLTTLGIAMDRLRQNAGNTISALNDRLHFGSPPTGLAKLDLTDWDKIRGEPALRAKARTEVAAILDGTSRSSWHFKTSMDPSGGQQWESSKDDQGRVTVLVPFAVLLKNPLGMTNFQVDALAQVRTKTAVDFDRVARAEQREEMPECEVISLEFVRAGQIMMPKR